MSTAIVLAGGVGSRLSPLTLVVPKPMVPFAGAPLLEYIVNDLERVEFKEVIIVARYLGDQIVNYFTGRGRVKPLLLDSKDTADAVRLVAHLVKGDFLVTMGDIVTNVPYRAFFEHHLNSGAIASIVLKEVDNPLPYGLVYVDEDFNVVLFAEKPPSLEIYLLSIAFQRLKNPSFHSNLVNAGIYAFREDILRLLEVNMGLMDFGRHVFPYLLETGYRVKGWVAPANSYWNDVGKPDVYKEALWDLIGDRVRGWSPRGQRVSRGVHVAEGAVVRGTIYPPVYIGVNAVVERGAVIGPYAVIEEGVLVESSARVSHSVVWQKSVISNNAWVHDSIIMNGVLVKNGVKVVSAIVGSGCTVDRDLYREVLLPCVKVSPYENRG